MKRNCLLILVGALFLVSCRQATKSEAGISVKERAEEPHKEAVTHWTAKTELFMEYPTLVAGVKSRFAVHFTSLETFKPQKAGKVEVILKPKDGPAEVFSTTGPSRPGIFGVDVQPKAPGEYEFSVSLSASDVTDRHELGAVRVYPDAKASAHEDQPAKEETVAFLKEQQWALDFATEVIKERPAREVLRVPAEISPRVGGEAEVTAPFSGRLASSTLPPIGSTVQKGQVLATIVSPTSSPSELPALRTGEDRSRSGAAVGTQRTPAGRETAQRRGPAQPVKSMKRALRSKPRMRALRRLRLA